MYSSFVQYRIIKEAQSSSLDIDTNLQGRINEELYGNIINYADVLLLSSQFTTVFSQKEIAFLQ